MKLSEFGYCLPDELIAQDPVSCRDDARLLVLDRGNKSLSGVIFKDIAEFINKDDLLVLNDTRVMSARLIANRKTGARLEILLLKEREAGLWEVLVKPGKKARPGERIFFAEGKFSAEVLERTPAGGRLVRFHPPQVKEFINQYGKIPLPHYIKRELKENDAGSYQTVYAEKEGAVAAPTAGLHFTKRLLEKLASRGTEIAYITLHCGLATFRPVKTPDIRQHQMDTEFYQISAETARIINQAKVQNRRVVAVGTSVARAMETEGFRHEKGICQVTARQGQTRFYIYPSYKFKIVDALLTNFHLPYSTNLILVSAFAGVEFIRQAYQYAIKNKFRFYSFGDATLII